MEEEERLVSLRVEEGEGVEEEHHQVNCLGVSLRQLKEEEVEWLLIQYHSLEEEEVVAEWLSIQCYSLEEEEVVVAEWLSIQYRSLEEEVVVVVELH